MEIESQDMPAIFAREMKFINWNWWAVVSAQGRKTCPGANISPFKGTFVDDVPFPQVGKVSFPRRYSPLFGPLLHKSPIAWSTASSTAPAAWSAADHELGGWTNGMSGDCWIPFVNRTLHVKPSGNVDIPFEIQNLEILMISKKVWEKKVVV